MSFAPGLERSDLRVGLGVHRHLGRRRRRLVQQLQLFLAVFLEVLK